MNKDKKIKEHQGLIRRLKKSLRYATSRVKPVDPADPDYPNATMVARCLRNADSDLLTEARFVLWQDRRIKELEAMLKGQK